jgi:hypothetical protein
VYVRRRGRHVDLDVPHLSNDGADGGRDVFERRHLHLREPRAHDALHVSRARRRRWRRADDLDVFLTSLRAVPRPM